MSTILLVVAILIGTLVMVVLAALLRGAVSYLNLRRHALKSGRRKHQTVGS